MRPASLCAAALVFSGSRAAFAQPVFVDDFTGPALAAHWGAPEPELWSYNFQGGRLNVTGLHYPSQPSVGGNHMNLGALFEGQQDFRADAWMSWGAFQRPQRLHFDLLADAGPGGGATIYSFGLSNEVHHGPDPVIVATTGGGLISRVAAPAPGATYQFTILRAGSQTTFLLDHTVVAQFSESSTMRIGGVALTFVGPYPGEFAGFAVDRIIVVPSPSCLIASAGVVLIGLRRRR